MILKENTVYVPIGINEVSEKTFVTMSKVRGQIHLKKDNLFAFSKEELIELLGSVFDEGSGSCVNNTDPTYEDSQCFTDWDKVNKQKEQFIQSLFNIEEDGK